MTAIWKQTTNGWQTLSAQRFEAEAALHDLVENTPQLLPLSGSPELVVVGREVQLGNGRFSCSSETWDWFRARTASRSPSRITASTSARRAGMRS